MRKAVVLRVSLFFSVLIFGCVTTSWEAYNLKKTNIERKCRIQLGWDGPMCKYLDDDAVESIGADGSVFP